MKLGLITDIHEQTEHLRTALACFRASKVEQVVVIGDVFGALCAGRFAIFDTDTSELAPFNEE